MGSENFRRRVENELEIARAYIDREAPGDPNSGVFSPQLSEADANLKRLYYENRELFLEIASTVSTDDYTHLAMPMDEAERALVLKKRKQLRNTEKIQ